MSFWFPSWVWHWNWPVWALKPGGKKEVEVTVGDALGIAPVSVYDSGVGEAGSEVVSTFDGKLYVTNGEEDRIDIIDAAMTSTSSSVTQTLGRRQGRPWRASRSTSTSKWPAFARRTPSFITSTCPVSTR